VDSPPTDVHRAPPVNTPVIAKATAAAPLSAEQLLAAAREGRLVLRLRAADDHAVIGRVEALRGNPRGIAIEQMSGAAYAVASNHFSRDWSSRLPLDLIRPPVERPPLPAVADGTPTPPHPPAPFAPPLPAHEPRANEPQPILSQQAFIASIPATADGLEGLLKLRTDVVRGEWTILADPMTLDAPADAQSILWWATPASGWAPRLTVPIVVQSN
ncbi:MAG TPA: hypothetical protein VEB22_03270, partial [Phycisphaerales bacterium]|nr:hypothetical protein [Phycisphaerales bacterium]